MKSKIMNLAFLALCISALILCVTVSAFEPDEKRSVTENRALTQYEAPTLETVLDGSWFAHLETYSKDQFFARGVSIRWFNRFLDSLHVRERNGYVLGEDGFVMSVNAFYTSENSLKEAESYGEVHVATMNTIQKAADTYGGKVIYLNIPHKVELYPEKYPLMYNSAEQLHSIRRDSIVEKAKAAGITVVETHEMLQSRKNEYIYYATDHHWTIRGAYYAYQMLLDCISNMENDLQLQYPAFEELKVDVNPNRMVGSYLKKLGDSGMINVDYMEYAFPYDMPEYIRYDKGQVSKKALWDVDNTNYATFMGGDIGNTVMETNRDHLPSILYIGCSYSNPLEVMSVYNFNRVESIDPRYWTGSICQYVKESKTDYIVIVRDDIYAGNTSFSCTVE